MDIYFYELEVLTGAAGLVSAHFFASDSSYPIFPYQGRFCQGRAERGLAVPLTGSLLGSRITKDESLRGHKRRLEFYSQVIGGDVHSYRSANNYESPSLLLSDSRNLLNKLPRI